MDEHSILDKHSWIAENVVAKMPATKPRKKNLQNIQYQTVTRNTRLVLAIMGCWGVYFPPYNLARLSALTREAGYHTDVFDFNVDLYTDLKPVGLDRAWDSNNYYWWMADGYGKYLESACLPFLNQYIDKIVATNPDIVGFSIYDTNVVPTTYVIKELKLRLPNITIIMGGPTCHQPNFVPCDEVDHWIAGEGEQTLIDFLENVENKVPVTERKLGGTYGSVRIDIDSLPFPDYTDYDLGKYTMGNGISAELSRGCVAKCSFCTETWFWKYRDRHAHDVLDEIEHQVKNYDINFIWFIDSLTNGNLKGLREFAVGIKQRGLNIQWMGYARCDGRMDLAYFQDLKDSGCAHLSFGLESGSQKVLELMKKQVTVDEMDSNLRDAKLVGIETHANWIIGFPNEDIEAATHSLNLLWNHRNNIDYISPGMTFGDQDQTDFEFNRDKYNISDNKKPYLGWWYTLDWSNTKLHRLIRLKLTNIWLEVCKTHGTIANGQYRPTIHNHYALVYDITNFQDRLEYEEFDYNIVTTGLGTFADTVVNEIWSFLRLMYRVTGAFEMTIRFNKELDTKEFGILSVDDYSAEHSFSIDHEGNWRADFNNRFVQNDPFWKDDDKSFTHSWQGTGKWAQSIKSPVVHRADPGKVFWITNKLN